MAPYCINQAIPQDVSFQIKIIDVFHAWPEVCLPDVQKYATEVKSYGISLYFRLITYFSYSMLFIQVFCTSLNGNTDGTKYQLSGDMSDGLVKLAK